MKSPELKPLRDSLRVMCYNILAPSLVEKVDYEGVKEEWINWPNRLAMIQKEIAWCKPHILCLQEVEEGSDIMTFLTERLGMEGRMHKKPESSRKDGPAIFFDKERF